MLTAFLHLLSFLGGLAIGLFGTLLLEFPRDDAEWQDGHDGGPD